MKIADILGFEPAGEFVFDGRSFEYHPGNAQDMTAETLFTRWADASRSVSELTDGLAQAFACLLTHRFKRGVTAQEREAILERARREIPRRNMN